MMVVFQKITTDNKAYKTMIVCLAHNPINKINEFSAINYEHITSNGVKNKQVRGIDSKLHLPNLQKVTVLLEMMASIKGIAILDLNFNVKRAAHANEEKHFIQSILSYKCINNLVSIVYPVMCAMPSQK